MVDLTKTILQNSKMTQYFGEESAFNEKVTFFKNANINGNLNVSEIVTATEFRGNGANLTGIQPFESGTTLLFYHIS